MSYISQWHIRNLLQKLPRRICLLNHCGSRHHQLLSSGELERETPAVGATIKPALMDVRPTHDSQRAILKFWTQFARLTEFDTQFVRLSEFDIVHANCFILGVFHPISLSSPAMVTTTCSRQLSRAGPGFPTAAAFPSPRRLPAPPCPPESSSRSRPGSTESAMSPSIAASPPKRYGTRDCNGEGGVDSVALELGELLMQRVQCLIHHFLLVSASEQKFLHLLCL